MSNALKMRYDIQGLRAIAVLAVIAFHCDARLLPGGFVGVDIFMVISGYLITMILLRSKESEGSLVDKLARFYASRFRRIAPAYYVFLLFACAAAIILLTPSDFGYYLDSLKKALSFTSNQYFAHFGSYFAPKSDELPLLHTWSLAIEMQFYLLAPLVVLLLLQRWLRIFTPVLLIALVLLAEYAMQVNNQHQSTYYALYARSPAFIVGGLAALFPPIRPDAVKRSLSLALVGAVMMVLALVLINKGSDFPGMLALLPCVGTALLIYANNKRGIFGLLSHPAMVFVGTISYSLYLWHWLVLACLRYYTGTTR